MAEPVGAAGDGVRHRGPPRRQHPVAVVRVDGVEPPPAARAVQRQPGVLQPPPVEVRHRAGRVGVPHDLRHRLRERAEPLLALPHGLRRVPPVEVLGDAGGDRPQVGQQRFGQPAPGEQGQHAEYPPLHQQRVARERDHPLAGGPLRVAHVRVVRHVVGQVRGAVRGDAADLELPHGDAGVRAVGVGVHARAGPEFEPLFGRVRGPHPRERGPDLCDERLGARLKGDVGLVPGGQRRRHVRAEQSRPRPLRVLLLGVQPLGHVLGHHPGAHARAVGAAHRERGHMPGPRRARGAAVGPAELRGERNPVRPRRAAVRGQYVRREVRQHVRERAPRVLLDRLPVRLGQVGVDPHVPQVRVEERDPDRRVVQERVQPGQRLGRLPLRAHQVLFPLSQGRFHHAPAHHLRFQLLLARHGGGERRPRPPLRGPLRFAQCRARDPAEEEQRDRHLRAEVLNDERIPRLHEEVRVPAHADHQAHDAGAEPVLPAHVHDREQRDDEDVIALEQRIDRGPDQQGQHRGQHRDDVVAGAALARGERAVYFGVRAGLVRLAERVHHPRNDRYQRDHGRPRDDRGDRLHQRGEPVNRVLETERVDQVGGAARQDEQRE